MTEELKTVMMWLPFVVLFFLAVLVIMKDVYEEVKKKNKVAITTVFLIAWLLFWSLI